MVPLGRFLGAQVDGTQVPFMEELAGHEAEPLAVAATVLRQSQGIFPVGAAVAVPEPDELSLLRRRNEVWAHGDGGFSHPYRVTEK